MPQVDSAVRSSSRIGRVEVIVERAARLACYLPRTPVAESEYVNRSGLNKELRSPLGAELKRGERLLRQQTNHPNADVRGQSTQRPRRFDLYNSTFQVVSRRGVNHFCGDDDVFRTNHRVCGAISLGYDR